MVVVPHVTGQLRPEVRAEVDRQHPYAQYIEQPRGLPHAYPGLIRVLWRKPGELIVIEQDTVPPPGSIARLLECDAEWCCHPHPISGRLQLGCLGLARFSAGLKARLPLLADHALGLDFNSRRGHCRRRGDPVPWDFGDPETWPTDANWWDGDTRLRRYLDKSGVEMHVHPEPTIHLHDYGQPHPSDGDLGPRERDHFAALGIAARP